MFSLTWNNIDFETGDVIVENRPATKKMPPFFVKDHEARVIPLPKHTLDILAELQTAAEEGVPFILLNRKRYETVLSKWQTFQHQGRPWKNTDMVCNCGREFKRHLKWADIKPNGTLSIHTLRKCCGKNWADHLPPNVVRELMGHSNIATTMKFSSKVDKDHRIKAAAVMDALISNATEPDTDEDSLKESDARMTPEANLD
jgi:integrase